MKKSVKWLFLSAVAVCLLCLLCFAVGAVTRDAADAVEFAAAVESAAAGDTVRVTGSFTAANTAVTVAKNLTLTAENSATITVPKSFLIVNGAALRVTGKLNIVSTNTTATEHIFKLSGSAPSLTIDLYSLDYKIEGQTANVGGTTYTESGVVFSNATNAVLTVAGGVLQNMGTGEAIKVLAGGTKFTWNVSGGKVYNYSGTGRVCLTATPTELNVTGGALDSRAQRIIQSNTTLIVRFSGGSATSGCGIMFQSSGRMSVLIEDGTITSTKTDASDGLFYLSGANASFTMTGGSVTAGGTKAVQIKAGGTVNISGGTITSKVVASKYEAAVDITGATTFTMTGGSIISDTSSTTQSGVTLRDGTHTVSISGDAVIAGGYIGLGISTKAGAGNTVEIGGNASITAANYTAVCMQATTTMTINGGSLSTTAKGDGIYWWNAGTLTVNDVTINGVDTGIRCASVGGGTINLRGGSITAKNSAAVYLNVGDVNLNVYDGATLTSTGSTGVYINHTGDASHIHFYGGTVYSKSNCFHITGGTATDTHITIDGGTFTTTSYRNIGHNLCSLTLVINGGTFNATDYCVYSQGTATGTYTINGGTFNAPANTIHMAGSGETTVTVTGGTFTAGTDAVYASQSADVTVTGGTFCASFGADARLDATIRLLGGDFSQVGTLFYVYDDSTVSPAAGVPDGWDGDTPDALVLPETYCLYLFSQEDLNAPTFHFDVTPVSLDGLAWYDTMEHAAADVGAYIGTFGGECQYFSSLTTAIAAAEDGDTIVVYKSHTVGAMIQFAKDLTLTGDGVTVSGASGKYLLQLNGDCKVTIAGSLTLQSDNRTISISAGNVQLTVKDDAALVSASNSTIVMASAGNVTVNVTGGTLSAKTYAIFFNGTGTQTANVSGGTLRATSKTVYFNAPGTLNLSGTGALVHDTNDTILVAKAIADEQTVTINLNGGSINAGRYAIYAQNKLDLNITGGTFTSTSIFYNEWYDSSATDGDYQVPVASSVTVTGGTIEAGATVFRFITPDATVAVSGDAVIHTSSGSFAYAADAARDLTVTISGSPEILCRAYGIYLDGNGDLTVNITGGYLRSVTNSCVYATNAASATVSVVDAYLYEVKNTDTEANTSCITIADSVGSAHITIDGTAHLFGQYGCIKLLTGGTVEVLGNDAWLEAGYPSIYIVCDDTISLTVEGGNITSFQGFGMYVIPADTNSVVNIYGGRFVNKNTNTGSHGTAITRSSAVKIHHATVNIWGGTFYGVGLSAIDLLDGDVSNIYGGTFRYNPEIHYETYGAVLRSGASTSLTVWGGTFISEDDDAPIFRLTSDIAPQLKAFNCAGGKTIAAGGTADLAYPSGAHTYAKKAITMTTGAQVRMVEGSAGLRFITNMSASAISYLKGIGATDLAYGTLIVPADYLRDLSTFTLADLVRANKAVANVPASDGLVGSDADGYIIRAALVNIKTGNLNRDFAAVGYVTYTLKGHEVVWYTPYRTEDNARTVCAVAKAALADPAASFTPGQSAILDSFADAYQAPVDNTDPAMQDLNILFVGNSMIYINDTYQTIERLIGSAGYRATVTELYHDSYAFNNWLGNNQDAENDRVFTDAETMNAMLVSLLENNHYDIVVFNQNRKAWVNDYETSTKEAFQELLDLVHEKQGDDCRVILYGVPPVPKMRDGLTTAQQLEYNRELYTRVHADLGVPVIFVTEPLYTAMVDNPDYTFMRYDDSHMNEFGSYIVACCLVKGIYGVSPIGLYNGMIDDPEMLAYAQQLADTVQVFDD